MPSMPLDRFHTLTELSTPAGSVWLYSLPRLAAATGRNFSRLPIVARVLLESVLRRENGRDVSGADVERLAAYDPTAPGEGEWPFFPARVLMQDFTGVLAVVDLAAMREAVRRAGAQPVEG